MNLDYYTNDDDFPSLGLEEPDDIQSTAISTPTSRGTRRQSYQPYETNNKHMTNSQSMRILFRFFNYETNL